MPVVFISYRRSDASAYARLLYQELTRAEGIDVFMDVDSIAPGADFVEEMRKALDRCDVTLAVIGPEWLSAVDRQGRQRLGLTTDHVRVELKVALESGAVVLPVLVGDAVMPESEDLPAELAALSHRNAILVHDDAGFRGDIDRLVRFVRGVPVRAPADAPPAAAADPILAPEWKAVPVPAPGPADGPPRGAPTTPWYGRRVVLAGAAVAAVLVALGVAKLLAGGSGSDTGTAARQSVTAASTATTATQTTGLPPPPAFTRTVAESTLQPPPSTVIDGPSGACVFKREPIGYVITSTGGFQCRGGEPAGSTDGLTSAAITVSSSVQPATAGVGATDYDAFVQCYSSPTSDYLFTVNAAGAYRLWRRPDISATTKSVQLASGTVPGINLTTAPATFRLECYEQQGELRLRALVNGTQVAVGRDPSPLPPGHLYFGVESNPKKQASVVFTDYKVEATPSSG